MFNALFIVWRECFEAVLIIGILYSYMLRRSGREIAFAYLWLGLAAGVALSVLLAMGLQKAQTDLEGLALECFEAGLLGLTAVMMTHMCLWMKRHSRKLKGELEGELEAALSKKQLLGVSLLAALALAREGFELVMFFYGMSIEATEKGQTLPLIAYSSAGVALTVFTAWAYYKGLALFNAKRFFQVTAVFLLVTANSLLLAAIRKLVQMDLLPTLMDQAWDTSWLLTTTSTTGQVISGLTGYEATPSLMIVLTFVAYWVITLTLLHLAGVERSETKPSLETARAS